jgi:hypothetical protein
MIMRLLWCASSHTHTQVSFHMAGSGEHIKALRLLKVSRDGGIGITEEEAKHLGECEECQQALVVFARIYSKYGPSHE